MRMITESSRMYVFTVNTYEELFNKDVFISVCRPATFLGAESQRQMRVACQFYFINNNNPVLKKDLISINHSQYSKFTFSKQSKKKNKKQKIIRN